MELLKNILSRHFRFAEFSTKFTQCHSTSLIISLFVYCGVVVFVWIVGIIFFIESHSQFKTQVSKIHHRLPNFFMTRLDGSNSVGVHHIMNNSCGTFYLHNLWQLYIQTLGSAMHACFLYVQELHWIFFCLFSALCENLSLLRSLLSRKWCITCWVNCYDMQCSTFATRKYA